MDEAHETQEVEDDMFVQALVVGEVKRGQVRGHVGLETGHIKLTLKQYTIFDVISALGA